MFVQGSKLIIFFLIAVIVWLKAAEKASYLSLYVWALDKSMHTWKKKELLVIFLIVSQPMDLWLQDKIHGTNKHFK